MLGVLDVNGLATLASVSDNDIPACAALRAYKIYNTNIIIIITHVVNSLHNHWHRHHT